MTEHNGNETGIVAVEAVAIARAHDRGDPITAAAVEKLRTASTEELGPLLNFLERLDANYARRAYAADMIRLRAALPTVIGHDKLVDYPGKDGRVKYSYMSLAALVDAVSGVLADHGFSHSYIPSNTDREVVVTCRLTHRDGHSEECTMRAPPDTKGGKSPVQAISSTATTLKRQTMIALLGLATGDMPDADDEPPREPADSVTIDPKRNNAMVTALRKRGRALADAEKLVGKKSAQWTAADREEVGLWAKGAPAVEPPPVDGAGPTAEELAEDERRMSEER